MILQTEWAIIRSSKHAQNHTHQVMRHVIKSSRLSLQFSGEEPGYEAGVVALTGPMQFAMDVQCAGWKTALITGPASTLRSGRVMLCVEQRRVFETFRADRYAVVVHILQLLCIFHSCTVVVIHATRYTLFCVLCASHRAREKFERIKWRSKVKPCCSPTTPFMAEQ